MNITAEVSVKELDEETIELSVNADPPTELGVLVGPRGTTLQALQEVTRTVVQSKSPSRTDRILVDVAQYRERRVVGAWPICSASSARGPVKLVKSGPLEPMSAADRKAVHDALTGSSTVVTRSEGEEPRRFVVVAPA
jgi:spoIIIJ-associated protein